MPVTPSLTRVAWAPVGLDRAASIASPAVGVSAANNQAHKYSPGAPAAAASKPRPDASTLAASRDYDRLLSLLHAEISKHKRYPTLARRQRREGTATVAFRLHPDGGLERLAVLHSSGYGALDDAAMQAVQGVAPFRVARAHLSAPRRFTVKVSFRLAD